MASTGQTSGLLNPTSNDVLYFYHVDHLGTPIMMTDENQNVVWEEEFLPFGEEYSITGTVANNLRFPGQYYDEETGLHQNWHRDYMPEVGRYLEKDPIGFKGGINPYIYSLNNPTRYIDPFGALTYEQITPIITANNSFGQSDQLITCVCWNESNFNPMIDVGQHRGLMQVSPDALTDIYTNYKLKIPYDSLYDAATNIIAGSLYLKLRIQWAGGNVTNGLKGYGTGAKYSATQILGCEKCLKDNPCNHQSCLKLIHP